MRSCGERLEDIGGGSGAGAEGERIAGMLESSNSAFEVVSAMTLIPILIALVANTYRLGFDDREYSYSPTGLPTLVCANVVDREICFN